MNARIGQLKDYNCTYDLIRGIAALAVFVHHIVYPLQLEVFGKTALLTLPFAIISVEFFFALSGILLGPIIYNILSRPNVRDNILIFLKRRWYRTLPTYYLGLFIYLLISNSYKIEYPENLIPYLFFLQGVFGFEGKFYAVSWSLAIEELFYLILPLLVLVLGTIHKSNKSYFSALILIIICAFVLRQYQIFIGFDDWDSFIRQSSFLRLDAIAAAALAAVYIKRIPVAVFICSCLFILVCTIYFSLYTLEITDAFKYTLPLQIIFTLLPWACALVILFLGRVLNIGKNKVIIFFADISYPLYVLHLPITMLAAPYISTPLHLVLFIIFTFFICWLVFRLIETPFLKMRPEYTKPQE